MAVSESRERGQDVPTVSRSYFRAPRPTVSPLPEAPPTGPASVPPLATEALASEDAEAVFGAIHDVMTQLREAVKHGQPPPVDDIQALVDRVIGSLDRGSDLFWLAHDPAPPDSDSVAAHLASVGVLSLRVGADLGYDRQQLADLGLAAFLFDIGLWQLPERLLGNTDPPAGDEWALYSSHPRVSADLVRRSNVGRDGVVETILAHHERERGQGYPRGLQGSAIPPHAKIIGLVDTYTRLISSRSPLSRVNAHEALRRIVRSKQDSFPSAPIKALLSEISVFPPRTMVKLNSGETGRVVAVNRNHPLRPKVEILLDSKGDRLQVPKLIDLSEAPFLYVTGLNPRPRATARV